MKNKGIFYVVLAALCFSMSGLFSKLIPWGSLALSGGRSIFACIFTASTFIITKRKLVLNRTTIFGGVMVFFSMFTFVLANKMTTAANTIVLEYTAPIFIIIANLILFNKKPNKNDIVAMIFVSIGIIIFFIDSLDSGRVIGNIVALASGIFYAFVMLNNSFKGGDGISSNLIGQAIAIVVGLPFVLKETNFELITIIYVIIQGTICTGAGYFLLMLGTKYCEPLTVSLIAYIEPVLNPIFVAIFYGEMISSLSLIGAAIVLVTLVIYNIKSIKNTK